MSDYDFLAESTGHVIGLRRGYSQGHETGYVDGHNDTAKRWQKQIDEEWQPLVDRLTAERDAAIKAHNTLFLRSQEQLQALTNERNKLTHDRDELLKQLRSAGQKNVEWHHACYSALCALDASMEVLHHQPQQLRSRMLIDYTQRANLMAKKGLIDRMPHENPLLRQCSAMTVDRLKGWRDQALAIGRKLQEKMEAQQRAERNNASATHAAP